MGYRGQNKNQREKKEFDSEFIELARSVYITMTKEQE